MMDKAVYARFWSKVDVKRKNECWLWKSSCRPNGYGELSVKNKSVSAHVLSFEYTNGEVPKGLWVDHICRNRKCVNPNHLRAVTPKTNALENSDSSSFHFSQRTHCNNGHEFTPENTRYVPHKKSGKKHRRCRACNVLYKARAKARKSGRV